MAVYVTGDDAGISAEPAQVATAGPARQSSAINFNAALGGWGPSTVPPSAKPVHKAGLALASVKAAQPSALQFTKAVTAQAKQAGIVGQSVSSSEQTAQDLRPRSSDGILQRITVDRGPATGQTF